MKATAEARPLQQTRQQERVAQEVALQNAMLNQTNRIRLFVNVNEKPSANRDTSIDMNKILHRPSAERLKYVWRLGIPIDCVGLIIYIILDTMITG